MSAIEKTEPAQSPPRPAQGQLAPQSESADLFDYALLRDYLVYVVGSARRHKLLFAAVFAGTVALAAVALKVLPKSFHAESKLLAQRNQISAALGNPNRGTPWDTDAPTRAATEVILRHDNLVSLARQTDLVRTWPATRAPLVKAKDAVLRLLGQNDSDEERLTALVGLLDKALHVEVGDGTVTIALDWPDAQTAYRLVEAAQQNFLEARHVSEVSGISEAISILEGHAALVRERVDQAAEQVRQLITQETRATKKAHAEATAARSTRTAAAPAEGHEVARLREMLDAKRRAIADLEQFRKRRLTELQAKYAEERTVYAASHPIILDLQQRIDAMEKEQSLQLGGLRQDEQELVAELARHGADARRTPSSQKATAVPGEILQLERDSNRNEDPALENAKGDLRFALSKYASLLDRIDSARMELDAARAAFKYRYSVVRPAEVPRKPRKPSAVVTLGAGVVLGFLFALATVVLLDLRRGRIVERWQVQRQLGLPVLSEVRSL